MHSNPLSAAQTLFDTLNKQDIKYCHWKSNQHLDQALSGLTDFDLLVARHHRQSFKAILYQLGCKSVISPPGRQYPAIEDYLGYDQQTGHFFHLHVHYELILGERFIKNHWLPLEEQFLETTILSQGVKIVAPELEVIVLTIRALLKYRDRDVIKDTFSIRTPGFPTNILREFDYLLQQTTFERIETVLNSKVDFVSSDIILTFLKTITKNPRSGYKFYQLRNRLKQELIPFQRYSRWQAMGQYFKALWCKSMPSLCSALGKKTPDAGGLTLALIGADGAGKSTTLKILKKWLTWKLNVQFFYMGSGEKNSRLTQMIRSVGNIVDKFRRGCTIIFGKDNRLSNLLSGLYLFIQHLRDLSIAQTRYKRYLISRRQAAQGAIIVYDRYPLTSIHRAMEKDDSRPPMDGPRIAWRCRGEKMSKLTTYLSSREEQIYQAITPPAYLIILHISIDVSLNRKSDHKREEVEPKIQAIENMERCGLNIIDIDATQPLEQTLLQVKKGIWDIL